MELNVLRLSCDSMSNKRVNGPTPEGRFGVEIETELAKSEHVPLVINSCPTKWAYTPDNTLCMSTGLEFVLKQPSSAAVVKTSVGALITSVYKTGAHMAPSHRCSTHVHVNISKMSVYKVVVFVCILYLLEDALFEKLCPMRSRNKFCIPLSSIGGLYLNIAKALVGIKDMGENNRYANINLNSISKHGSVELRMLPGIHPANSSILFHLVDILDDIVEYVNTLDNKPAGMITHWEYFKECLSYDKVLGFFEEHIPSVYKYLRGHDRTIKNSVYQVLRIANNINISDSSPEAQQFISIAEAFGEGQDYD